MAEQTKNGAFTLIGGGNSTSAAINMGFKDNFSWISTAEEVHLNLWKKRITRNYSNSR
ncbi:phosphoglycerate kinase [Mycoplasma capricolum subsp. capricolum]